jgi:hypothetical protein
MEAFDVVIPVGPNDAAVVPKQLEQTKKNLVGYRNIYIVSKVLSGGVMGDGVQYISESQFPFSIQDVAKIHGKSQRNGWYLQQLLKLYAGTCIPGILPNYLVLDSDTFFLKPTRFMDGPRVLFNCSTEYHAPYFSHMKRLHPSFERAGAESGICHHMLITTAYVKELMALVEDHHKEVFWKVFLAQVEPHPLCDAGASEYELYFHFMRRVHPEVFTLRRLNWKNTASLVVDQGYDYVSVHWYARKVDYTLTLCIPTMDRWDFLKDSLPQYLFNPYISEIVICDENGHDAQKIQAAFFDPKIRLYVNSECLGPFRNKRKAVSLASNPFVCLMDSDNFAPLSYFDAWAAWLKGGAPSDTTVYAPYRTIPQADHEGFDFSIFTGLTISRKECKYLWRALALSQNVYNTGNYIVPKRLYTAPIDDPSLNFEQLSRVKSPDVMFQNYLMWIYHNMVMVVVPGMDYHHIVHPDSYYMKNHREMNYPYFNALYEVGDYTV